VNCLLGGDELAYVGVGFCNAEMGGVGVGVFVYGDCGDCGDYGVGLFLEGVVVAVSMFYYACLSSVNLCNIVSAILQMCRCRFLH
jgi:hypothetical protein